MPNKKKLVSEFPWAQPGPKTAAGHWFVSEFVEETNGGCPWNVGEGISNAGYARGNFAVPATREA
jgi:hypothetical protein|eukprot:CAMPEP_0174352734 /NCGR_PEP_ID=MMETSP0811_2-20130205/12127_1 /TAXON_ID=73025 ORGANISM="Eutreptiella gymnastica-like, Strain CCMP1594" /NCGR_SAMPLE_ID=MMETSP0811_2 /ASSEMBLY_ACC=CAM_ASM_000667 /LENGTH=64 /DNA_ID=CAMNT_0015482973 /DNA_START=681 /DNA_END=875 /DNA_ORIENTATION=-